MGGARFSLEGRVILVTGGASGIGLATARASVAQGATAVLVDCAASVSDTAKSLGGKAVGVCADVTDFDGLRTTVQDVVDEMGGIDVVVANAGLGPKATTIEAGDREHQRAVLDVNLHGVWHTAWATAPHVVRRQGHLVLISSVAAFLPAPMWAAYAASKAAVEQLARSMRLELAVTGTTVGVAHFGLVDTALVDRFEQDPLSAAMSSTAGGGLPGTITRKAKAVDAGEALIRSIERRKARLLYPRWWWGPYLLRGLATPTMERMGMRNQELRRLLTEARARDLGDVPHRDLAP